MLKMKLVCGNCQQETDQLSSSMWSKNTVCSRCSRLGPFMFLRAKKDKFTPVPEKQGNCWTIHLIPDESPEDRSKWLSATYVGPLSKKEIEDMFWKDAISQGVISNPEKWTIRIESGIALQWAD